MTALQPMDYNKSSSDTGKLISFIEDTQNFLIMILEKTDDFKNLDNKKKKTLQKITYPIIEELGSMRVAVSGKSEDKIFKEKLSQSNLTKNSLAASLNSGLAYICCISSARWLIKEFNISYSFNCKLSRASSIGIFTVQ